MLKVADSLEDLENSRLYFSNESPYILKDPLENGVFFMKLFSPEIVWLPVLRTTSSNRASGLIE